MMTNLFSTNRHKKQDSEGARFSATVQTGTGATQPPVQ